MVEAAQQITNRRHDAKLHSVTYNILAAQHMASKALLAPAFRTISSARVSFRGASASRCVSLRAFQP